MLYLSMYISKRLWMLVKPSIRRYRVKPKCVHVIPTYLHTYTYIIQHLSASTPTRHHYQSFLRRNKLLVGQSARHSAIHLTTCSPAHSVTRIPTPSPLLFNLSANKYFRYRAKQSLPNHNNNINCTKAACCYSNDIFGCQPVTFHCWKHCAAKEASWMAVVAAATAWTENEMRGRKLLRRRENDHNRNCGNCCHCKAKQQRRHRTFLWSTRSPNNL